MSAESLPLLYSFRRCPYAIRARLALHYAGIRVALREVVLKDKPPEMLAVSPKGTVPVLVLDGDRPEVIDESLEVMLWALAQHDPDGWLAADSADMACLIDANDDQFKPWLDRYKYPNRYADLSPGEPEQRCAAFLEMLDERLGAQPYLCGDHLSLADMALRPFVRQYAFVDIDAFRAGPWGHLNRWLQEFLDSELFASVMEKYPQWHAGEPEPVF